LEIKKKENRKKKKHFFGSRFFARCCPLLPDLDPLG